MKDMLIEEFLVKYKVSERYAELDKRLRRRCEDLQKPGVKRDDPVKYTRNTGTMMGAWEWLLFEGYTTYLTEILEIASPDKHAELQKLFALLNPLVSKGKQVQSQLEDSGSNYQWLGSDIMRAVEEAHTALIYQTPNPFKD